MQRSSRPGCSRAAPRHPIAIESRCAPFTIDDGTGLCRIEPRGAELALRYRRIATRVSGVDLAGDLAQALARSGTRRYARMRANTRPARSRASATIAARSAVSRRRSRTTTRPSTTTSTTSVDRQAKTIAA